MLTPEEETMTEQTNSGSCCGSCGTGAATGVQVHGSGVTTVYKVSGMTCGHCESAISKEVSALDGVTAVTAVADTGEVTVTSTAPLDQRPSAPPWTRRATSSPARSEAPRRQGAQPPGEGPSNSQELEGPSPFSRPLIYPHGYATVQRDSTPRGI